VQLSPGWNTVKFPKLPAPPEKPKWFPYNFQPDQETFLIYLPKNHAGPYAVLGWTNPGDQLAIPKKFEPLFEELGIVAITAERCGNKQVSERRAGLLVSGILALDECVRVNRERVVLSGLSGGGRLSALGCFVHPEFFRGAVSWCGGNFYKDYPDLEKEDSVYYGIAKTHNIPDAVTAKNVSDARRKIRFVMVTGEKDFNYKDSHYIEAAMKKDRFDVQLIDEPGLGHTVGSVESMRRALDYVLGER
jgi:esterase/lipase superfamily enzyme